MISHEKIATLAADPFRRKILIFDFSPFSWLQDENDFLRQHGSSCSRCGHRYASRSDFVQHARSHLFGSGGGLRDERPQRENAPPLLESRLHFGATGVAGWGGGSAGGTQKTVQNEVNVLKSATMERSM